MFFMVFLRVPHHEAYEAFRTRGPLSTLCTGNVRRPGFLRPLQMGGSIGADPLARRLNAARFCLSLFRQFRGHSEGVFRGGSAQCASDGAETSLIRQVLHGHYAAPNVDRP